jgi:hypothetical protein
MRWDEFERACPELAELARNRFARDQLVMLGTIRRDGSPRISPCELDLAAGQLLLGMMWRSPKAMDLMRDARIVVHSVTCDREGTEGDVKLYGHAIAVEDPEIRTAYRDAIQARIDWAPREGSYHLFALDVRSAGYLRFEPGHKVVWAWDRRHGLRKDRRPAVEA